MRRGPPAIAAAYSATGQAWQDGPARIYDRLAEVLVQRVPHWPGRLALDLGAGTGAASAAIRAAGGTPIALDAAIGMLAVGRPDRPAAVAGDALALPFQNSVFDAVVAAFSLNHLLDPVSGLREATRVIRSGGSLVASAYAADDTHPVKAAVEQAAREQGWVAAEWYGALQRDAMPHLATVERAEAVAGAAGLAARVEAVRVAFPELTAADLVGWRLGMPHMAWFVDALPPPGRAVLAARSLDLLGESAPLERSLIVVSATIG
jgi:ubiquinone/menaquinone biosynthesis C-methylase UbiE